MAQQRPHPDLTDLQDTTQLADALQQTLAANVFGQTQNINLLIATVLAAGHALIVGPPGLAKTLLGRSLADALDLKQTRIQFTPDLTPADILGTTLLDQPHTTGHTRRRFVPGPIFTNLLIADEINRAAPATQAALLQAMAEQNVCINGSTHALDGPFCVVATQNPIEHHGTYPLPESQLDRFMTCISASYPDAPTEQQVALQDPHATPRPATHANAVTRGRLLKAQALVHRLPVADTAARCVADLVRATRPGNGDPFIDQNVRCGASPRASQHLLQLAQALAAIDGQPTPDLNHIRRAAMPTLAHRILPTQSALAANMTPPAIIHHALNHSMH